jgi:hypothetical protein
MVLLAGVMPRILGGRRIGGGGHDGKKRRKRIVGVRAHCIPEVQAVKVGTASPL